VVIAFETAANVMVLPPADENSVFTLYSNRTEAFNPPSAQSADLPAHLQRLSPWARAGGRRSEFRGIPIGEVTDISAQIDVKTFDFSAPVTISSGSTKTRSQKSLIWVPARTWILCVGN